MLQLAAPLKYSLPKEGYTQEQNDDSLSVFDGLDNYRLLCVVDGATESLFARQWSQCLSQSFYKGAEELNPRLFSKRFFWDCVAHARKRFTEIAQVADDAPWYIRKKAQQAASAAIAVILIDIAHSRWKAFGIGDVCIFHYSANLSRLVWPLSHHQQFTTTPDLVESLAWPSERVLLQEKKFQGIQANDILLIATDTLAAWMLQNDNQPLSWINLNIVAPLLARPDNDTFQSLMATFRNDKMRNDDVTLIIQLFER